MRIALTTLGCKINQYETDAIKQDLLSKGNTIVPFDDTADVYVINTCSVTKKSDDQCRQIIRSAIRRGRGAQVVVTGCYAETQPDELHNIPGVTHVVGNSHKAAIADRLMAKDRQTDGCLPYAAPMQLAATQTRTRGFLKIQDGCNNNCSYCIVPRARGNSRSVKPDLIEKAFLELVQAGYCEIVLTGIHIGSYGADLEHPTNLSELIQRLVSIQHKSRIRISSIEPMEITEEMTRAAGRGICRHFHIPLQSGDDSILAAMNRKYSAQFYGDLLQRISGSVPGIALGADVIVGFPGEGEQEFHNTLSLVESSPLTHLHVFSFSSRPGTRADSMSNKVPDRIIKGRSEELRDLGRKKNFQFRVTQLSKSFNVIVEDKIDPAHNLYTGLTDNYIRVLIVGAKAEHVGKDIAVQLTDVQDRENFGTII